MGNETKVAGSCTEEGSNNIADMANDPKEDPSSDEGKADTEGGRLRKLLALHGLNQADLAHASKVSRAAVYRWYESVVFKPKTWRTIASGLERLKLDPKLVKTGKEKIEPDLKPLIKGWNMAQIRALGAILTADERAREVLLHYIQGAIDLHDLD